MDNRKQVLDHGYIELVESWGSDERIIEAARMSTAKGFLGWGVGGPCQHQYQCGAVCGYLREDSMHNESSLPTPLSGNHDYKPERQGDEKLLRYLWEHKHATPFEMAGMTIEVQAPIFVFREWHRHRTQCLAGDTLIHFDMPRAVRQGKHTVLKRKIKDLWQKWQPTIRNDRPERQTNPLWPRSRIQGMSLRTLDESTGEFTNSRITGIIRGDPKEMHKVTTTSGRNLSATMSHQVFTSDGWMTIEDAIQSGARVALEGTARGKLVAWEPEPSKNPEEWRQVIGWEGVYVVSNWGRVKRVAEGRGARIGAIKKATIGMQGYPVVGLTFRGNQEVRTVHSLVLEAFVGVAEEGQETRHKNHNRLDCRVENLEWGSSEDNSADMLEADRCQRLIAVYEAIESVECIGEHPTYDIAVCDPWHNFVANGFVVHNSYNEMSARYTPLPDLNYVPTVERLMLNSKSNKQAGTVKGAIPLTEAEAERFQTSLEQTYAAQEELYQEALAVGVPKELARVHLPVGRYSRMRASANLRNWLAFLTLRMAENAQWEIRQYANVIGELIAKSFPRTWELFSGNRQPS